MITVGYGDIIPKTSLEKIFSIFIIILSCGVFAYSINRLGAIIQQMQLKDDELRFKNYSLLEIYLFILFFFLH